jgi:SepF-like predicted cell division protein (DUF552 family)
MDKLINKHIDQIEDIENNLDLIIEQEILTIDIDEVIRDPQNALLQVAQNIKDIFLEKYGHDVVELGIQFGKAIQKKIEQDKTIKVDDTNDPKANA